MDCSVSGVKPPSNLRVSFRAKSECHGVAGAISSRGPSPLPCHRLSVPSGRTRPSSAHGDCSKAGQGQEVWLDEGNDLIKSCGALSKVFSLYVGSYSTSPEYLIPTPGTRFTAQLQLWRHRVLGPSASSPLSVSLRHLAPFG